MANPEMKPAIDTAVKVEKANGRDEVAGGGDGEAHHARLDRELDHAPDDRRPRPPVGRCGARCTATMPSAQRMVVQAPVEHRRRGQHEADDGGAPPDDQDRLPEGVGRVEEPGRRPGTT